MKKQSKHTGFWIGISVAIVVLTAAGILLFRGLLKSIAGSSMTTASHSREASVSDASTTPQTEPGESPVSSFDTLTAVESRPVSSEEETAEAPSEGSSEAPAETPAEISTEGSAEAPAETPAEISTEGSAEAPAETPAEISTEGSAEETMKETEASERPKELSEADLAQIDAVQLSLAQLRDSETYQAADPTERARQVLSLLDTLAADGSVDGSSIYYDAQDNYVSYRLPGGVLAVEKFREQKEKDDSLPPSSLPALISPATTLLPEGAPADAVILNGMTDRQNVMEYCLTLQAAWTQAGLRTDLDTEVTVEDMKDLAGYEFVYVKTHGCFIRYLPDAPAGDPLGSLSVIVLEQQQDAILNRAYRSDLAGGCIVLLNGRYCITPAFIREYYGWGELEGNIIFLGCCQLMGKNGQIWEGWTSAFEDSSLAAFVAFYNSNFTMYNLDLVDVFVQELLSGSDVRTAYETALAKHGRNDAIWAGSDTPDQQAGTPLLRTGG